ncbi:MAG: hypothetical protein AAF743_01725, partial [Planctomycetota bacterium]
MLFSRHRLLLCSVLVALIAAPSLGRETAYEPGVAVQVYQLEDDVEQVPRLAPNQTPNLDEVFPTIDFGPQVPWASDVPGRKLVSLTFETSFEAAGKYDLRLTFSGAARLRVWGRVRGDTRLGEPNVIETSTSVGGRGPVKMWIDQLVVDDTDATLKLEYRAEGTDVWRVFDTDNLRTPADPTRVTSPGPKQLANSRAPGDGNPVAGLHPAYDIATIRPPESKPSVGAMTFLPDGRLIVGTFSPLQR